MCVFSGVGGRCSFSQFPERIVCCWVGGEVTVCVYVCVRVCACMYVCVCAVCIYGLCVWGGDAMYRCVG